MELRDQKTNNGRGSGGGPLITLRKVGKSYATPAGPYPALRDIDLEIGAGEFVALVGKSGSGKTTLLNLIGGTDRPSEGEVIVAARPGHQGPEKSLARWRGKNGGGGFQFFHVLPTLTVAENVMLPMDFCNVRPPRRRRTRALELLDMVGIADQADKLPSALSGGQPANTGDRSMSGYRQKVIRDFWQERTRAFFVALAIAIGISAFSAVLSSYAILTRELDKGYLETNPASATLRTVKGKTDTILSLPPHCAEERPRKRI